MLAPTTSPDQSKSYRQAPAGLRRRAQTAKAYQALGELSVSDGRQAVGTIKQAGDHWTATTTTGERLGPFPSMVEAARALPRIIGVSA